MDWPYALVTIMVLAVVAYTWKYSAKREKVLLGQLESLTLAIMSVRNAEAAAHLRTVLAAKEDEKAKRDRNLEEYEEGDLA